MINTYALGLIILIKMTIELKRVYKLHDRDGNEFEGGHHVVYL